MNLKDIANKRLADNWVEIWTAVKAGKMIQLRNSQGGFMDIQPDHIHAYSVIDLRIKPIPRRIWANQYPAELCNTHYSSKEQAINSRNDSYIGEPIEFIEVIP
jgi:hypothetical protein